MNPSLLSGLRIIEFSAFVAAPSAGLALAQLGADVIRVDPRGGNIDVKRLPLNAEGRSLYWASLNRGKRSVELDVRSAEGRALLQRLICAAGDGPPVFLTNLAVDGELSYAALSTLRPDLIMVQLSGSPDGSQRGGLHRQLRGRLSRHHRQRARRSGQPCAAGLGRHRRADAGAGGAGGRAPLAR